jgi:hypothetical protein
MFFETPSRMPMKPWLAADVNNAGSQWFNAAGLDAYSH